MKSRISFFDRTLLRKDLTRFAPVWILYLIGGLMVSLGVVSGYGRPVYAAVAVGETMGPLTVMNLFYALVVAECLFGDLYNSRMCNALHALPLRREKIYATHVLAGMIFSVVPNLLFSLVLMSQLGSFWYVALLWALAMLLQYLFFFALASVCALSTGSRFAMAALYALIAFLSEIVRWFVTTFYEPMLHGMYIRTDVFDWFCPAVWGSRLDEMLLFDRSARATDGVVQVLETDRFVGLTGQWWYFVILAAIGLALLGLGVWLYRKRKLECAGDFLAFRPMIAPCSVIFTLAVAALFQIILGDLLDLELLSLIAGFLVGCFGVEMLLRRTVKVFDRRTCIKCVLIGGIFALSLFLTKLDPVGLTRWTPQPEKVSSVTIIDRYYYDHWEYSSEGYEGLVVTDPEQIARLVEVHGTLVEAGDPYDDGPAADVGGLHMTYRLTDGRTVVRRYRYVRGSSVGDELDRFFSLPQAILCYNDWEQFLTQTKYVGVEDLSGAQGYEEFHATTMIRELMEAVRKDCEDGHIFTDGKYEDARYVVHVANQQQWRTVYVGHRATETLGWIRENLKQEAEKLDVFTDQDLLAGEVV